MAISVLCSCGAEMEATDDLAGQSVKCPQCAAAVSLPAADSAANEAARVEDCIEAGTIPAELKQRIVAELGTNERPVWMGQPESTIVFRRSLGYLVGGGVVALISALWLLGAMFTKPVPPPAPPVAKAGKQAVKTPPPPPVAPKTNLWFPVGFFVGSICFSLVPVVRWKLAQRQCYALTNRRVLVFKQGLFGPTFESYSPLEVSGMRRSDSWVFKGGGDLIFRTVTVVRSSYSPQTGTSRSVRTIHYGFLAIPNVREIERLVRETLIDRFVDKLQAVGAL
jgi:hypothetical protein